MNKYIIIRAGVNGGKTTTSSLLFEELKKSADFFKVYNYSYKELSGLKYNENGSARDFIGVLIINGKLIIIISQGDVAKDLKRILDELLDEVLINKLTNGIKDHVDIFICCARSQMKTNSTIEMLIKRIPSQDNRKEFWTKRSEKYEDRNDIKKAVVKEIADYILLDLININ